MQLCDRLAGIQRRIGQACGRSGRPRDSVTLIGVTKTLPAATLREAVALGLRDFGESRVQEARLKRSELGDAASGVRWHMIGHLQRNKVKAALALFDSVHSVDSVDLARALNAALAAPGAVRGGEPLGFFLEVNVAAEPTKKGCAVDQAAALAREVNGLAHLRLDGLMTIAPYGSNPEDARPVFRRLAGLRNELAAVLGRPAGSLKLSMGMSQDFETAIEEGADFVRIGTALFGERE